MRSTEVASGEMSVCSEPLTDLMFRVGSVVECHTLHDEVLTGEVLAFEYAYKLLVLQSAAASGQANLHDVTCVNLNLCSNIRVLKDGPEPAPCKLPEINLAKVKERTDRGNSERNYIIEAFNSDYGNDGIFLYYSLIKTLGPSNVCIEKSSQRGIIIKETVRIGPPYGADCVSAVSPSSVADYSVNYARQLVEKFWLNQNKDPYTLLASGTPSAPNP